MKRMYLYRVIALFLVLIPASRLQAREVHLLQAGAAIVDISPKTLPALQNGGFLQRVSNRVADPLSARCLVVSDGKETIAIVIVD